MKDLQKKIDAENLIRDATKGVLPDAKITYTARSSPPIKKINQFEANNGEVFEVKFSPDGAHLATAGEDKCVNIYNVRNPASRIESPVLTLKGRFQKRKVNWTRIDLNKFRCKCCYYES